MSSAQIATPSSESLSRTMKAAFVTRYGAPDVLQMREVATPTPRANEILIRVRAASVGYGDLIARRFAQVSASEFNMPAPLWLLTRLAFGLRAPRNRILGSEFAGVVVAAGPSVTRFKVGDAVFGYRGPSFGANAEYLCMAETGLVQPKPTNLSFEEAAVLPYGALTAISLLRKGGIQPGQRVLIVGASGSIGAAALQLAKHYGAHVTGVCGTARMAMVRALGADEVIDYTRQEFTQMDATYDLIFEVLGRGSFSQAKRSLRPGGRYLYASFKMKPLLQMLWTSRFGDKKVICAFSSESVDDLRTIGELAEAGVLRSVIDRCFPLEQAAEAHRYLESGQRSASVVLTPGA